MLEGLTLEAGDVGVMQDLCGFGFVIDGDKRFCDVFTGASSVTSHFTFSLFIFSMVQSESFD